MNRERECTKTQVGLDILFEERISLIAGRRVGLITNHTGIDEEFQSSATLFAGHPEVRLSALFSPEHGLRGSAPHGVLIPSAINATFQIPVHSLYGERRAPTPEMLAGIDVLMFDIQDVGSRFFTYISTLRNAMQAAMSNDVDFMVLDRPNPIRGDCVEGNLLQPALQSFVGPAGVPIRHGMTTGELARLFQAELELKAQAQRGSAQLEVVPMQGWRRAMWYDETGLPWVPPSPNMPTTETAALYPGTCLVEGTNLSEGRGTTRPFEWIGAPWIKSEGWAETLNSSGLPGVYFRPIEFAPTFSKFAGQPCRGVQVHVTNRDELRPVEVGIHLIAAAHRGYPDRFAFLQNEGRYFIDLLAGTDELRLRLIDGEPPGEIIHAWEKDAAAFRQRRRPYLLYD